ncbi:type I-E CRISPR-associated protein Cas7/Cse4/CasC [Nesterenkonia aerolata]|uniref:Type I-E CRISPR-associated protein Cas7/Cse4/CasC n=1 Tax=Nesterenkonia aerolata TaxID=3074079 RepID=A0ABU2DS43_9MICC|nr:type I-E CRISPR-associated protein Cas7/Cse4/CasC [Nesterenkonia sp. LY-0111]MDR8019338.1 type I-E CRISPR-associated protein Cas7/Cse4/CasC [Nesterenkonia sp. LY-0111]
MPLYLDIHALHTVPPNNLNRDDTGAPKTATFGGVVRQRVSSQAWKRAIRKDFENHLDPSKLGVRSRRIVSKVVAAIRAIDDSWTRERAAAAVEKALKTAKIDVEKKKPTDENDDRHAEDLWETKYLLFLSTHQIQRLAEFIVAHGDSKYTKKQVEPLLDEQHSVDIAMFGRMVADAADFNVDASVQVAHALGVSAAEPEFDYFTAVDDVVEDVEETGAAMIGTIQMMSSTLYRYATVDVDLLGENLGSEEAAQQAAQAFVRSFINSMPTGKQNTFANRTLPEAVVVVLRRDRPVSWVNAFEEPVPSETPSSRRVLAAEKLAGEAVSLGRTYASDENRTWVVALQGLQEALSSLGPSVSQSELLNQLEEELGKGHS